MLTRPSNKPRAEIEHLAHRTIQLRGGPDLARVWYKFDCGTCGHREVAPEPNVLPVEGVCTVCGARTAIRGAGFALQVRRDRYVDWDNPATTRTLVVRKAYASDKGEA